MADLEKLKPKVRALALDLARRAQENGIDIMFTCTLRTASEQDKLYARGRTVPGKIVTQTRGGESLHNYGVAFDVCPVIAGRAVWNDASLFNRLGRIGRSLGLEWGGDWRKFPDKPHFQYTAGYELADFRMKRIDEKKFI